MEKRKSVFGMDKNVHPEGDPLDSPASIAPCLSVSLWFIATVVSRMRFGPVHGLQMKNGKEMVKKR